MTSMHIIKPAYLSILLQVSQDIHLANLFSATLAVKTETYLYAYLIG